jgi:hypothetical protein
MFRAGRAVKSRKKFSENPLTDNARTLIHKQQ